MGQPRKDRGTVAEHRVTIRVPDTCKKVLDELVIRENAQKALRGDPLSANYASVIRGLLMREGRSLGLEVVFKAAEGPSGQEAAPSQPLQDTEKALQEKANGKHVVAAEDGELAEMFKEL